MKKQFNGLKKKVNALTDQAFLSDEMYKNGKFTINLNIIKSEKGEDYAVKTAKGTESVKGFSFPHIAQEFGFYKHGNDYVFESPELDEQALSKLKKDKLLDIAGEKEVGATADNNKTEIIDKILGK